MRIRIRRSERVAFFGRTGSGKTTLARALLRQTRLPYVVLDPKHRFHDGDVKVTRWFNPRYPRQIVRVDPGPRELDEWDEVCYDVWRHGDRLLYVDEATLINPGPRTVLPELGRAIRTGRESNVAVWCASQRPKDLPSVIFTEAEHFFLFRLNFAADRDKVSQFTADDVARRYRHLQKGGVQSKHDFLYYNVEQDALVRVRATRPAGAAA